MSFVFFFSITHMQGNWDKVVPEFDEMELREDLLRGIFAFGFEKPSPIQQRAIAPIAQGQLTLLVLP